MTDALQLNLSDSTESHGKLKEDQVIGAYVLRGWAYLQLTDPSRALSEFSEALRQDQELPNALLGVDWLIRS